MIDYKKHKSNFSPYLEKLYQSDKPMIIYKYKDGYKIFTDFSKRIVLNNSNIEKFLNNISKKKFKREQDLYVGFFGYEILCNLLNIRIKNQKIPLTICVDKVAASGGYMMACLADKLVAAPFSIIGSIGVLVQLPNFHRVLKKYDVDYEMISAGEYKRTLSHFGEITTKGKDKVQEDVENIHRIFKDWVKTYRPSIEIDSIATGETWVGTQAKDRYMVDEIKTSDECIIEACEESEVFEVEFEIKKSIQDKLGNLLEATGERLLNRWFSKSNGDIYQ